MDAQNAQQNAQQSDSAPKAGNNKITMYVGIAIIAVLAIASLVLIATSGKGSGNTSSNGFLNGGNNNNTDVISQAFSSSANLTGAQLANITAKYSKTVGPLNVSYDGGIISKIQSSSLKQQSEINYSEDVWKKNESFRTDLLMHMNTASVTRYSSYNVTTKLHSIVLAFANGTTYGCTLILNSSQPQQYSPKGWTCYPGTSLNSELFNFSNQFGSTPDVTYKLVGKGSVIGIPCDILVGSGTLATANVPVKTYVNVTTCVSFKYLTWLNYTMHLTSDFNGDVTNSSVFGIATALNGNIPANFTQLPPNATIG
ncbi:MAG: hypothetical protein M1504_01300 [Candidatus Marsarchaeota archaeon]|nr:hypothetical protein [Candidatus Marsarchaeota archaeon]